MKRILVTGANKGIGQAIVKKLLEDYPDTHLLLGSRSVERGEAALEQIVEQLGEAARSRLEVIQLDVTSEDSVNKAVENVAKLGTSPLYGLVNNAGGWSGSAKDVFDLNMYGLRRVCEAFLPLIQKDKGRIVQISSGAAPMFVVKCSDEMKKFFIKKDVTWEELENTVIKPFTAISDDGSLDDDAKEKAMENIGLAQTRMGAYGVSKACVNSYTISLANRAPSLLINSCSPGFIETDLTRPFAERQNMKPSDMGMLPVEKGAISTLYLMMGDLEGDIGDYESGRYYGSDAKRSPLHKTRNPGDPVYQGEYP